MANDERSGRETRHLTDAAALRALSHPIRIKLYEVLGVEGPLTATEAGEIIGESPSTCSFHLRQLAKYGYVEEAGTGKGRQRPWRAKVQRLDISIDVDDAEVSAAAGVLGGIFRDRSLEHLRTWHDTRSAYPAEWRRASGDASATTFLTPDELRSLLDELMETISRYTDRLADPTTRPANALPVELLLCGFPIRPPATPGPSSEDG